MAGKFVVFITALAMANAVPIWVIAPRNDPNIGQAPSLAYGFGSGFSSDVAGVKHSTSIGSSFSSGDATAYGQGISGTGNSYARGVGAANIAPTYYTQPKTNDYGYGQYYNPALPSAQAYNSPQYGTALRQNIPQYQPQYHGYRAAVTNAVDNGQYRTALSSAQNVEGQNFESAVSATQQGQGYNSAISNAQSLNAGGLRSATAASEDVNGYKASTAHAVHQNGGTLYNSGATTINGPGIQAAQSHAISYF
ncbi:uncharacterized protein LOC128676657 [Plodia interpunctella]|uniref:uncharacterized protein LOC128676657 n=1 Tax=Plodia interpunctella TaxID=58824 RepID=UPI0023676FD0|nr:uncharacterized protein LOC128676657 [Plodia interpunctella]